MYERCTIHREELLDFVFTFICALCSSLARVCIDFIRHIFVNVSHFCFSILLE